MNFKNIIFNHIPARLRFAVLDLKKNLFNDFGNTHYSQFGEDIILSKLFKKKNGIYVDVGAHHPRRYSNTYLLHKKGWSGINIDPNKETIRMFRRDRPRDRNILAGIGKNRGELVYYSFSDPALNTFEEKEARRWFDKDWVSLLSKDKVNIMPLRDVLKQHLASGQMIDVLNIDTEGMDCEVLESFDWETEHPYCIVIESPGFSFESPESNPVYSFLHGRGYTLHAVLGPSLIFILAKT